MNTNSKDERNEPTTNKRNFFVIALLIVVGVALGAIGISKAVIDDKTDSGPSVPERSRAEIEAACRGHLTEADTKASRSVERRSAELAEYIESRKSGARGFSREIVSWYGKWRAIEPHLPFTDSEGHKKFVAEKLAEHLFTTNDLSAALTKAIEGSIMDLESIENDLAVALRQEILGRTLSPDELPIAADEFRKVVERMVIASQRDTTKAVGSLVVSEVAAQVGSQILVRLGVSAGIFGGGAVNSWWSFGAAFVIGLIVDAIWEWLDDPAGDIEREMASALDKLSLDVSAAIKEEMNELISRRAESWRKTVAEILP